MSTDAELLQRYTREKSEAAFAELVQRHLPLVYSAAVRQTGGDAHLAQDVAQTVFTALARKAATLTGRATLAGWLYLGTHHAAAQAVRTNRRREAREQEAHAMHELLAPATSAADWDRVRPVLDEAMRELSEPDREAVLLRYFEQRPFADIGAALNLSEDAARMRVERALDKLHALLARRGITSTTAALAVALQGHVIVAAPAGLATTVTGYALGAASGAAIGGIFAGFGSHLFSTLAAVTAVAAALYQVGEQRAAERAVAVAIQQSGAAAVRVRELERRATEAAAGLAGLERAIAAQRTVAATTAALPAINPDAEALRAGAELVANHPEVSAAASRLLRGFLDQNYVRAMLAAGLTESEAERVAIEIARMTTLTADVAIPGVKFELGDGKPEDVPRRLRELLGDERAEQVQEARLALTAKEAIGLLAGATFDTDLALTPQQLASLSEIVDRQRTVWERDGAKTVWAIDWPAITRQAATVLSAPQLAAFQYTVQLRAPATQTLHNP